MASGGALGDVPSWYANVQAAKWLGVPLFQSLNDVPIVWRDRALAAMSAESDGRDSQREREAAMREMGF